jgi:ABC-type lipoprotein release transport system permease subunit
MRSLLFQVPERDPWTLVATSAVLVIVAIVAAWIPSRRASNIDPIVALRHD